MDKEILMELLAKRKNPKVDIEKIEIEPEEEEDTESTDMAPEGKLIEDGEEMEEEMGEHEDKEQDMDLIVEMLGGMSPEQMGSEPKSLRERAIVEMMKRKAQKAV